MNQNQSKDGWGKCPAGTLTEPAASLKRKKQSRRKAALGSGAAVLMLVVGASAMTQDEAPADRKVFEPSSYQEPNYGGVTCSVVRENVADYKAGTLDHTMCEKMEQHVGQCSICSNLLAQKSNTFGDHVMVALVMKTGR